MARRALGPFLAVALACACAPGGGKGSAHALGDHPLIGAAAPALDIPALKGKARVALASHAGQVVIVDFWATWCEPCRQSFPAYQKLVDEFGGKLSVLGVSVDESPEGIPAFVAATGAKFPVGWDEGQVAAQSYKPPKMPTSFIVDGSGIVRFVHAGFSHGDEVELRQEVRSLF
jgi:thiol-disulfide isomerase/thioredoxin